MPELRRITFSDEAASAYVYKKNKGIARCNTKGRAGKGRISLWRELCDIMVHKKVVSEADLDGIRAALGENQLPSLADVRSICSGELLSFLASFPFLSHALFL
jgi:hypothetical protein